MLNRTLNFLKYALGWPFSVLAFLFILKLLIPKIPEFIANIHSLQIQLLIYGVVCFIVFYLIRSYIWFLLVRLYADDISFKESAYFWAVSELKRYIPGSLWSFMGRTVLFSKKGITNKNMGKLLIMEAILFVLGAGTVSFLAMPFIADFFVPFLNPYLQIIAVGAFVLVLFLYVFNHKFSKILPRFSALKNVFHLALSFLALLFFGVGNYLVISSVVSLSPYLVFQLSGFFVLSFLLGYLSLLTPAGFGVREGVMISGLTKLHAVTQAAFGALFSRVLLIISELIFISILYLWNKSKNKKLLSFEGWIYTHKQVSILAFLFVIYVLYFSTASFLRFDNFYAGRFDLGNMAQTVWNTTKGRIFLFTNPNGTEMISRLAFHADFILVLLAPIYAVFPNPKTLLFVQAFVVGAGSFFVYLIAREKLKDKNLALVFAFAFLINPSVQRATLYDFHSVTLATTFLLGTYYFYTKKKYVLFLVLAILAALSKEQVWLIVALFGGLLFLKKKTRLVGVLVFFSSMAIFYYLVSVAIPSALGSKHFALAYYSDFGDGPLSIIKSIFLSPQKILHTVVQGSRINYLAQLFAPLGYVSLLSPFYLIFAVPDLLINLLSNNSQLHEIYYHYTSAITPFIFISSILGVVLLRKILPKIHVLLIILYILSTSILSSFLYGPLPGAREPNIDMFTKPLADREFIDRYLASIPRRKSVASSNNIGSHLSQRQRIYTLPLGIDKADVIVFLLNDSESQQSISAEKDQLKKIRTDKNYELTVEKGLFVVFKKRS